MHGHLQRFRFGCRLRLRDLLFIVDIVRSQRCIIVKHHSLAIDLICYQEFIMRVHFELAISFYLFIIDQVYDAEAIFLDNCKNEVIGRDIFLVELACLHSYTQLDIHHRFICLQRWKGNLTFEDSLHRSHRYIKEFDFDHVRDWKLHSRKRLKRILFELTDCAFDGSLILTLHKIDDNRLISLQMKLPVCV